MSSHARPGTHPIPPPSPPKSGAGSPMVASDPE